MRKPLHIANLVVLATALVAADVGLILGALGPSLPLMHQHLRAPLGALGILFGVNFAGSLLVTLWLGPLLDRRHPRPFLVGGVILMAGGTLLLPLATNLSQAVAALGLAGLGAGTNSVGSSVLTTRLYGGQDGRALSWINMSFGLGAFGGPLIAAAALEALHDYRPVFAGIALIAAAPALIYALVPLPPPMPGAPGASGRTLPRAWWPATALLALVGFLYLGAEVGFGGWVFTYVRETSNADAALASWAPAGFWLALSAGSIAAAMRPRAIRSERLVLLCGMASTTTALLFFGARGAGWQVLLACILGFCLGPIYPLTIAAAAGLAEGLSGRVSGLVIASSQVGGAGLPWLQGLLLARGPSWGAAMTVAACLALSSLQCGFIAARAAASRRGAARAQ